MNQIEHETGLVRAFIRREKHDRMLGFLAHPKKRSQATNTLYHLPDLNEKYIIPIESKDQNAGQIARLLREKGAPETCWVVSTDSDIDAKELELDFILSEIVGLSSGSLLSCIPGELAYYEGEMMKNRFILHKPRK